MSTLFAERGGSGEKLLVLLHGLGATAAVWHPLQKILEREWRGRWIAPDFRAGSRRISAAMAVRSRKALTASNSTRTMSARWSQVNRQAKCLYSAIPLAV